MNTPKMVAIRFERSCAPYHAGETAAFPEAIAEKYVAKGLAKVVELPKADAKAKA